MRFICKVRLILLVGTSRRPAMPVDDLVQGAGMKEHIARTLIRWLEARWLARFDEAADAVALTDRGVGADR